MRILLFTVVLAAAASADFPSAEDVAPQVRELIDTMSEEEVVAVTGDFIAAETPDQGFGVVRFDFGYFTDIYTVLVTREGEEWRVTHVEGPMPYLAEFGGDDGTVSRVAAGDDTYYVLTYNEASYGSGMGTEYDYYVLYRVDGEHLVGVFEGETGARDDYYSRWYGGEDSSAWTYGGSYETATTFTFEDVDGDGTSELWAVTRESPAIDAPPLRVEARLYAVDGNGLFVPADVAAYRDALSAAGTAPAMLLLARAALTEDGDVAVARSYLKEAAALGTPDAELIEKEYDSLARFGSDPPEAVALYYRDEGDDLRTLAEKYPGTAAGAEAVVTVGGLDELVTFLKKNKRHERWPEAYAFAAREALYSIGYDEAGDSIAGYLSWLKKNLGRYLDSGATAEEKARTATHLADSYFHTGDFDEAARLYEKSLAAEPHSVFEDYNYLRLGDCAAAAGDDDDAIGYYADCVAFGGWWGFDAAEMLLSYASVREGSSWRYFPDYLEERGDYKYLSLEAGDLDGEDGADFAALVQWNDEPHELYAFFREGEEFCGDVVLRGGPSLWYTKIVGAFESGPQLLCCNETVEDEAGRVTYRVVSRYDGSQMREVARIKVEESRAAEPEYAYAAEADFVDTDPLGIAVAGTSTSADGSEAVAEEYRWDEESFTFVIYEP